MIIYGGQFENGQITNEMLNYDLEYNDWGRLYFKQNVDAFIQGSCCSVMLARKQSSLPGSELTRLVSFKFFPSFLFIIICLYSLTLFLMAFTISVERIPKASSSQSLNISSLTALRARLCLQNGKRSNNKVILHVAESVIR